MAGQPQTVRIGDEEFRLVATIDPGRSLSFYAGSAIAVEKMDMRPGGTEFDFDVTSRATRNGRAESIAANRSSLRDEFTERRVKSNVLGLPVSIGNAYHAIRGNAPVQLTYGEVQPQVFRSRVATDPVGWTIDFRRAHYAGMGRNSPRPVAAAARPRVSAGAQARANGSAIIESQGGARGPGQALGTIQPIGTNAVLRLYVRERELARYRASPQRFGRGDMIFDTPSIFERLGAALGLGG